MKIITFLASICLASADYSLASQPEIDNRVERSKTHLNQSEGGKLLWESIEAHGGLKQWFTNGLLHFRWTYNMEDLGVTIDSSQIVDTWSSRAIHQGHGTMEDITFGWDGKDGWVSPADAKTPVPPAFWALTPYYFVGVPHVLADPGTIHEKLPSTFSIEGKEYLQVKVTYEAGTGETPDDYYIALIEPESKMIKAVRYIVTSPLVMKGKKPVEKLLTFEGWHKLSGVFFPKSHITYSMNGDQAGEKMRSATVSDAQFLGEQKISFEAPK